MSKLSIRNSIKYLLILLIVNLSFNTQAATTVTASQSSNTVYWQISGNSYAIEGVTIVVTGPENSSSSISGCTSDPLICSIDFNHSSPSFDTSSLSDGSYNWSLKIFPAVGASSCDSPADVRENQGGYQGLTSGGAPNFEALYLSCLINAGLLPSDNQELVASGSFNLDTSGLIVPGDDNPSPSDNVLPVAKCQDVTIEGSSQNCSVYADVNNGSFDPDGTIDLIAQDPDGPYPLGMTKVLLTVTDNEGDSSSCSATVTVTDNQAPQIQCPSTNTMTPPDTPSTFTASSTDSCSVAVTQATSYDCYRFNPHGKRIDTNDSCVVSLSNDSVTVLETSGVNSFIDWTVEATDSEGNTSEETCTIEVLHPNS